MEKPKTVKDIMALLETEAPTTNMPRLMVTDAESGESRFCDHEEARDWNWGDPSTFRMINGWQIWSYERLISTMQEKAAKGAETVELIETPRYLILSGG